MNVTILTEQQLNQYKQDIIGWKNLHLFAKGNDIWQKKEELLKQIEKEQQRRQNQSLN